MNTIDCFRNGLSIALKTKYLLPINDEKIPKNAATKLAKPADLKPIISILTVNIT
jgi:hypothetical protein